MSGPRREPDHGQGGGGPARRVSRRRPPASGSTFSTRRAAGSARPWPRPACPAWRERPTPEGTHHEIPQPRRFALRPGRRRSGRGPAAGHPPRHRRPPGRPRDHGLPRHRDLLRRARPRLRRRDLRPTAAAAPGPASTRPTPTRTWPRSADGSRRRRPSSATTAPSSSSTTRAPRSRTSPRVISGTTSSGSSRPSGRGSSTPTTRPTSTTPTSPSALTALAAIRELAPADRPETVYGCEVWRNLDWMPDEDKVALDVGAHESLSMALIGVYDSQVAGGKRYDLATLGRRRANATYFQSHETDTVEQLWFAMDLTPARPRRRPRHPRLRPGPRRQVPCRRRRQDPEIFIAEDLTAAEEESHGNHHSTGQPAGQPRGRPHRRPAGQGEAPRRHRLRHRQHPAPALQEPRPHAPRGRAGFQRRDDLQPRRVRRRPAGPSLVLPQLHVGPPLQPAQHPQRPHPHPGRPGRRHPRRLPELRAGHQVGGRDRYPDHGHRDQRPSRIQRAHVLALLPDPHQDPHRGDAPEQRRRLRRPR